MSRLAKWLPRLILAAAFVTILPIGKMVWGMRWYNGEPNTVIVTARERFKTAQVCLEVVAAAKAKGKDYKAREYMADCHKLLPMLEALQLRGSGSPYDRYVRVLCDLAQSNYDPRLAPSGFSQDFAAAYGELGNPLDPNSSLKDGAVTKWFGRTALVLGKWYLKFIPFALMLILLQIESRKDKIKLRDELSDWRGFLLNVFFWPNGLTKYSDKNYRGVVLCRYLNLRARYEAIKRGDNLYYRLSPEEDEKLWKEAEKSDDYISQVARLAQVSRDLVAEQSLASIWVGATLSLFVLFFTAGRCLAASNELPKTTTAVVANAKGEDLVVAKKLLGSSLEAVDQTSPTDHFHQVAILPPGWIPFEVVIIRPVRLPFIRPPPAPVSPIDHVPWLCD